MLGMVAVLTRMMQALSLIGFIDFQHQVRMRRFRGAELKETLLNFETVQTWIVQSRLTSNIFQVYGDVNNDQGPKK